MDPTVGRSLSGVVLHFRLLVDVQIDSLLREAGAYAREVYTVDVED